VEGFPDAGSHLGRGCPYYLVLASTRCDPIDHARGHGRRTRSMGTFSPRPDFSGTVRVGGCGAAVTGSEVEMVVAMVVEVGSVADVGPNGVNQNGSTPFLSSASLGGRFGEEPQ
jgi:hypothetical protein